MLYLVSTPIGNLEEMSPRALRVLSEVPLVLVEKKSDCLKLLHHFNIRPPEILQYDEASHKRVINGVLKKLAEADAAYITSAGTPGVSDPGARLVAAAREAGIALSVVSGPSALSAAIAVSGAPLPILFLGFLDKKASAISKALEGAESAEATLVFYESTHRIIKTLIQLESIRPQSQIVIAKELTKLHEHILVGTPTELLTQFKGSPSLSRGEFVVVIPASGS
jgi:16S rRNA (cytidine1402-2'-O)-methyltransferase